MQNLVALYTHICMHLYATHTHTHTLIYTYICIYGYDTEIIKDEMMILYPKLFCDMLTFLCCRYMIFKRWNKFGLNTSCTSRKHHIGILISIGILQTVKFRLYLSQDVWLSTRCATTLKFPWYETKPCE